MRPGLLVGIGGRPRVELAALPTPLQPAERLGARLGVPVWLKRDDLTGLGLGGNKVRMLEYLLGDALAEGCDTLVTGAGPQSNWAMLAALAARRCGLEAVLCLYGSAPARSSGNLLLTERFTGAQVRWTGDPDRRSVDREIERATAELRLAGRHPYALPRGGATAVGALGYLAAATELAGQLADQPPERRPGGRVDLWLATGSCGTQAGLVAGMAQLRARSRAGGPIRRVVGVTVSRPEAECRSRVLDLAVQAAELAGTAAPDQGDVTVLGGWTGPGYGRPSAEGDRAAELMAETEGVLLDPAFGAKATAALIGRRTPGREPTGFGRDPGTPVVLLVSGGAPALFADAGGT